VEIQKWSSSPVADYAFKSISESGPMTAMSAFEGIPDILRATGGVA
jgi:hypothetical protein